MKKHFRILAAALALCMSVAFTPASAATARTAEAPAGQAVTVSAMSASKKTEEMVWIPTHGGKKYHSKSTCSNMKDPEKVTLSNAKKQGFTACKKCY